MFKARSQTVREHYEYEIAPKLRTATVRDYAAWLRGFMEHNGKPTHFYEYPFRRETGFKVAQESFGFQDELHGSQAIHVIAADPSMFLGGPLGHCTLYFMSDFSHRGAWVPVYPDVVTSLERG